MHLGHWVSGAPEHLTCRPAKSAAAAAEPTACIGRQTEQYDIQLIMSGTEFLDYTCQPPDEGLAERIQPDGKHKATASWRVCALGYHPAAYNLGQCLAAQIVQEVLLEGGGGGGASTRSEGEVLKLWAGQPGQANVRRTDLSAPTARNLCADAL
jgi:hypothetical protein